MTGFLAYLLKSALLLAVFDSYFLLVMRHSSHFRFNRIALMAGSLVCLLLPLIQIHIATPTPWSEWIEPAVVGVASAPAPGSPSAASTPAPNPSQLPLILTVLYFVGTISVLAFFIRSYRRMFRLLRRTPSRREESFTLHLIDQDTPSFSWMKHIVINRSDFERYPAILQHEKAHVRCAHSVDLMLSSLLCAAQWFNPLVWICRTELKQIHEYEADSFVLDNGIDATQYQLLLVKKAVGEKRFLLANGFNHAKLKNRIKMMQTPKTAAWKKLSLLLALPLLSAAMLLLAECKPSEKAEAPVATEESEASDSFTYTVTTVDEPEAEAVEDDAYAYDMVEVKPGFNGGDANNFSHWVNEKLRYPEEAKEKKLQGRVTLQFNVEADGRVTDVKVLKGVDPILDREAVKIVSQSPDWTPGKINGKPVRVTYVFPVIFQLK